MSISVPDRKILWAKSGAYCAFPECRTRLIEQLPLSSEDAGSLVVVAEEAHIRSARPDGPRHDPSYDKNLLDSYENIIILCAHHHALIDKKGGIGFTVEELERMKSSHESAVAGVSPTQSEIRSATDAANIAFLCDILSDISSRWEIISLELNFSISEIHSSDVELLESIARQLLAHDWPAWNPAVQNACHRFSEVLRSCFALIGSAYEPVRNGYLQLVMPHKRLKAWDPERYNQLLFETNFRLFAITFLVSELTRSINLIISATRLELDAAFWVREGKFLMRVEDLVSSSHTFRLEYPDGRAIHELRAVDLKRVRQAVIDACGEDPHAVHRLDPLSFKP